MARNGDRTTRSRRGNGRAGGGGGRARRARGGGRPKRVRYAVIGLGHIAQAAVLPAFAHARRNAELTALISGDRVKQRQLSRRYGVPQAWSYDEIDEAFASGAFDAVYIAEPNHLHHDLAVRAARAGLHVLCEKPMALTVEDCEEMIREAERNGVRLMTAYRLHFEPANLRAIEIVRSRKLGEPRVFESLFGMNVKAGDIRLRKETGGGTLWDIGIYCINAARYLFRDEPIQVYAKAASRDEERFRDVEEMASAVMTFPGGRHASFTVSFGSSDVAYYSVLGTAGSLCVDNAYEYAEDISHELTVGGRTTTRTFKRTDQFAAELLHFSDCVLEGREPEPSGLEGMIDVAIIQDLYRSIDSMKPVEYQGPRRERRPTPAQKIQRPPVRQEPELVHTSSPTRG